MTLKCKPGELAIITRVDLDGCGCESCRAIKQQLISRIVKVVRILEDEIWSIEEHIPVHVPFVFGLTRQLTLHAIPDSWLTPLRGDLQRETIDTPIGHRIPDLVH